MGNDLPSRIRIIEEGPREGFQSEPPGIPTAAKVRLIEALATTGLTEIACCSFVDPRRLPQMADAEAIAAAVRRRPGVAYRGLWLNGAGFDRARSTTLDLRPIVFASASATFGERNNGRSPTGMIEEQRRLIARYQAAGLKVEAAYVFTAFGCNYEGDIAVAAVVERVAALVDVCAEAGERPPLAVLCDTVGAANPLLVERLIGAVRERWPDLAIGLHLHDTRGLGLANAMAGLRLGVTHFESSCAGLGGCPFAGNRAAAGNIATEDLAFLCAEIGVATGLDLEALIAAATLAEEIVGHPLPGRTMKGGSLARFRSQATINLD
ncbi:hydroxymethylglutaryl-CoA lyase [Chelatococcus reniformis]|uniref:Hydroxymethylglutaryl-CoA lyase n=1 Tax=Chelatococcus reniformis TaxID=1494448 RepID=A0A916ULQ1_9HYPH|nr:hydroxymethylglutaryl-CoA lyase [Chelatococcus reniformis]GGC77855.1 hydroxymethylglutaryl-CoA lyase [Chelatococcus reniformis]